MSPTEAPVHAPCSGLVSSSQLYCGTMLLHGGVFTSGKLLSYVSVMSVF